MPLELHADDGRGGGVKRPLLALEEEIHDELFAELRPLSPEFPLLMRLADYYGSTYYLADELSGLAEECGRASRRLNVAGLRRTLADLAKVAIQVGESRLKLYTVPD